MMMMMVIAYIANANVIRRASIYTAKRDAKKLSYRVEEDVDESESGDEQK
jgi:hypothetical protein